MDTVIATGVDEWSGRLDQLIAELSSTLTRVDPDDGVRAIDEALRRIGESLDVDRLALVERTAGAPGAGAFIWPSAIDATMGSEHEDPLVALVDVLPNERSPIVLPQLPDDLVDAGAEDETIDDTLRRTPLKSAAIIAVTLSDTFTCVLAIGTMRQYRAWSPVVIDRLRLLAEILGAAWYRHRQDVALRHSRAELARLTTRGAAAAPPSLARIDGIIGDAPALRAAIARLEEVASSDITVLLLGETGTGKERFARALHGRSGRRQLPMVSVNCAALPPTLIESELFGHERGAFTGAMTTRLGRFEVAHRGTLFLDEIGDLPPDLQAKLLRVLQEGEFERLGSSQTRRVDIRVIAATNHDLDAAVADGTFREDLFYRLNVFPIRLPPLRERREDLPALVWFLIRKRQTALRRWITQVPDEVMTALQRRTWPGNIRELENVIERALVHSTGSTLVLLDEDRDPPAEKAIVAATTLCSVERAHIEEVLRSCGGRINGIGNAADRLGLHPNTLRHRMKKLGIERARPGSPPAWRLQ
jgi:transcriptional regulator with GAF, ATPase, and Fis domain